jgi:polyhydroxybutyrate depolymerase
VRTVLLTALISAIAAACAATTQPPAPNLPTQPGTTAHTLVWGGQRRTYLLHLPARPTAGHPALVVVLHGATLTDAQTEAYYRWDDLADASTFAVAYPQGIGDAWNAGSCCADAPSRRTDDVGFIGAVLSDATGRAGADPARRYLVGVSNGAMMALRYECARPGQLAAIGSVAGTFTSPCDHPPPVPFIAIHGLADRVVTYQPSPTTSEAGPYMRLPAQETIARYLAADGCHGTRTVTAGAVHTLTGVCAPGLDVTAITIDGAGHQWPGATIDPIRLAVDGSANQPSRSLDATAALWAFFSAHALDLAAAMSPMAGK